MALRYRVICNQRCDRQVYDYDNLSSARLQKLHMQNWGYDVDIEPYNTGEDTTEGAIRSMEEGK